MVIIITGRESKVTNRAEYKEALSAIDRNTRICLLHLEKTIDDKFKTVLTTRRPDSKPDLSSIEAKLDSLQKQIDGLRPKLDAAYELVKNHDEREKYLEKLVKKADEMLEGMKEHFEELYKSGYYTKEQKRKIRKEGLIK
ncbi:unnamed protein product [marine sediment metagenome]|uniref:Uncharacterized protein n=1 Tax=marine sediment metagenome TaxID=412755 RepID=X1KLT6_9ZZZZ